MLAFWRFGKLNIIEQASVTESLKLLTKGQQKYIWTGSSPKGAGPLTTIRIFDLHITPKLSREFGKYL